MPRPELAQQVEEFNPPGPFNDCGLIVLPGVAHNNQIAENINCTTIYLQAINTPTAHILFQSDAERNDITPSGNSTGRKLNRIIYRDSLLHRVQQQYAFTYSYFNTGGSVYTKRLRLNAMQEVGKPSYAFSYINSVAGMNSVAGVATRGGFAKDHWGFYNGQDNNNTSIPSFSPILAALYSHYTGANRIPNGQYSKLGALTQIQYPTGGWTTFEYEPNKALASCDLGAISANQFGGFSTGATISTFTASVHGGAISPGMNQFEQYFATFYRPLYGGGSGGGPSDGTAPTTLPQNVRATRIDAPRGFFLVSLTHAGVATSVTHNSQGTAICSQPSGRIKTYFCRLNTDSTSNTYGELLPRPICEVGYSPGNYHVNGSTGVCTTSASLDSSNAKQLHYYPAGVYYLVAEANSGDPSTFYSQITANLYFDAPTRPDSIGSAPCFAEMEVGGVRLRKSVDCTGAGDTITTTYRYRQLTATGWQTSGVLFSQPTYAYIRMCGNLVVGATSLGRDSWLDAGYHIGYRRVEIETSGKRGGTTVNYYLNGSTYGVNGRNLLFKTQEFAQNGALVRETTNSYAPVVIGSSPGFFLNKEYDVVGSFNGAPYMMSEHYYLTDRSYAGFWPQLTRTVHETFGTAADHSSRKDTTTYTYLAYGVGNTTQPVRTIQSLGHHQQRITLTRYCGQYHLNPTGIGVGLTGGVAQELGRLADRHLISVPVEHQTWLRTGRDSLLLGSDLTHFRNLRPARMFALAITRPLASTDFMASDIGAQDHAFHQDPHYIERVAFPLYSPWGNLRQQRVAQAPPSSYLWGYEETKPLAEVKNAPYQAIAFTSFEEEAAGRFSYNPAPNQHRVLGGRTGRWAYRLNGGWGVSRDSLAADDYELMFWAQSATRPTVGHNGTILNEQRVAQAPNGWYQYRLRLRFASTGYVTLDVATGDSMLIDEVRLHPAGAQMTSYTYDLLAGETSQTDPSGRTITYEYDALGRLVRTRDEQGRLLSQQEYHYARPQ
jgi:YD repeat-containing protein